MSLCSQTSFPSTLCTLRKYNGLDSRVGQPAAALQQTQGEQVWQAGGLDMGPRIGLVAGGGGVKTTWAHGVPANPAGARGAQTHRIAAHRIAAVAGMAGPHAPALVSPWWL